MLCSLPTINCSNRRQWNWQQAFDKFPLFNALSEVILISRSPAAAAAATTAAAAATTAAAAATTAAVVEASAVVVTAAAVKALFLNPCQVTIVALSNNELLQL